MMENHVQTILKRIKEADNGNRPFVIALDGRCGAGKSTLAARLGEELNATLFHMDDFFLRPEQRTAERFSTPGENVDHERFLDEVLKPLREGSTVSYAPFSCATQTIAEPTVVVPHDFVIIEGSYALHPELQKHYDFRIFLNVSPKEQETRIRARNGDAIWPMFRDRWIPMEEAYFRYCFVCEIVDLTLWTDSQINHVWNVNNW